MKASEIRNGNYHYYHIIDELDERKEWNEVSQIDGQDIVYLESHPDDPDYNYIPLTEEWLLKFGFMKIKDEQVYCDDGEFTIKSKRFTVFTKGIITHNSIHGWYLDKRPFELKIKFVHQLQNLYFALTGKELTIK